MTRTTVDPAARLVLIAAFLLEAAIRTYHLTLPFGPGFDGWLGALYGGGARNLARSGFVEMRLMPHLASGPLTFGEVMPQTHHPPFVWSPVAVVFRTFGVSEWSARLLPSLATFATLGLLYLLVRRIAPARVAAAAALAFAALPMTGLYGGLVNFEPFVLTLTTGTYLAYLRYRETGRPLDLALTIGLFSLAILADWFGAFIGLPIAIHALVARPHAPRWFVPLFASAGLVAVAAVFAYLEAAWPGAMAELVRAARHRTSAVRHDFTTETYSLAEWLDVHRLYLTYHYTPLGLLLGTVGPVLAWRGLGGPGLKRAAAHTGLLALLGAQTMLVFPQASFQHAFLSFPLSLACSIGIALGAAVLWQVASRARRARAARIAVILTLGLAMYSAQRTTWANLAAWRNDTAYRTVGAAIRRATAFEGGVAIPDADPTIPIVAGFYADRVIYGGVDSLDQLDRIRRSPPRPSAPPRYVVFTRPTPPEHLALARDLLGRYAAVYDNLIVVVDLYSPLDGRAR